MKRNNRVYIIGEMSANHNNDFDVALRIVKAIADSGADAVKVQTYTADSLALNVDNELFGPKKEGLWKGVRPYDLYREASMPYEWQPKLKKAAEDLGIDFLSSPFDIEGVDFLESIGVSLYKIASFEVTDIPLVKYVASKGKPVIISTGVAGIEDIELALEACREVGNDRITLLKCTSRYPAKIEDANLNTIPDMRKRFGVEVGVSDHTFGSLVPVTAVALGARIVEKHFILDRGMGGPDSAFSMEPAEFKNMVEDIRKAEASLGQIKYDISENDKLKRRSVFVVKDIVKGEVISTGNVRSLRPGHGLHPKYLGQIIGKVVTRDLKKGEPLKLTDIEGL